MHDHAERETLLADIVEQELTMFLTTPNAGGPASCQKNPAAFRLMRRMMHCVHDTPTLASYLGDLRAAAQGGRNIMLEKYARMDALLPPLSINPLVDEIADAETAFWSAAAHSYPQLVGDGDATMFRRYLRAELETLSDATLRLYAQTVRTAQTAGRNLAAERYAYLTHALGRDAQPQG